ncbi:Hypothetical protein FKW44_017589 [Caligus rogercresseyi]|uniref:Uncharacterized protein n=2 Tax=Caligus rogercresseyi TaxID=217165 RepID=A0A7T8GT86_CALRO|nr:Hypothetical protein FKW44_017589 [Caligus rogercresseyi]
MNYLRFRLQNSPFINYAKDTGDDLPSSHPPTSFKLIAAAPRNPRVYFQDKNKTSNNTILSTATNHNDTHNSFMIRAVICPPIRRRPLFRGGGGGPPALHPLILKQSTISTVAAGHAMKIPHKRPCMDLGRDSHPPHTLEGGPNTTTPSPALASLFSHSKSILGN